MTYVELTRWAAGTGIRLPKEIIEQIGLSAGDRVEIVRWGDSIVICKAEDETDGATIHDAIGKERGAIRCQ